MLDLNKALDFAVSTAREAGAVLRDYNRNGVTVKYKSEIDLITEADHASEALILNRGQFTDFSLRAQGVLQLGSAALDLGAVAAGRLDDYWEWKNS